MGFLNSLYQIGKNNDNFKRWEQDQRDNAVRREELYKQKQHSKEDLEKAKELGKTIIDVVDVMDNHSENVAENVETATAPIVALTPIAAFLLTSFGVAKFVAPKNYKKISETKRNILNNNENIKLFDEIVKHFNASDKKYQALPEWEKEFKSPAAKNGWKTPFSLINKRSIDKIKDPVLKNKALSVYKEFLKQTKNPRRALKFGGWGVIGALVGSFIGVNIYATKLQVDSSRIARFQARENLSDPKAFVSYTPEQIAEAKEYIKQHPELLKKKKKEKLKSGMFKSIVNLFKDRKAYKKAKAADVDESKKVERKLTKEEIIKAKKDQEVIQRAVRLINNEAERYSENMETTADFIMGATPIFGLGVGFVINKIANWTGVTDRIVKNIVNKHAGEETKTAYMEFASLKKGAPGYSKKYLKFADKIMDEVTDKSVTQTFITRFKKGAAAALAHQKGRAIVLSLVTGITTGIGGALLALKLQKSAARAGRYTAKRELEKDPRNFIGYTDEDFENVKHLKGDEPKFSERIKSFVTFVPRVLKQYFEYSKFRKHEYKENQVLNEQLQKTNITDDQLKEAKNLQRKLFNTFEKVDDGSQQYSESMEAAIDIAQPFVITGGFLGMVSPFIYLGVQAIRGKKSPAELLNKITGYLSSGSKIMESKYFKKYVASIAQNIEHKVGNVDVNDKYLGAMLKGVNLKEDYIPVILSKMKNNLHESTAVLRTKSSEEQVKILEKMREAFSRYTNKLDAIKPDTKIGTVSIKNTTDKFFNELIYNPSFTENMSLRADMIDIITCNTKYIKEKMTNEQFSTAFNELMDIALRNQKNINVSKILTEYAEKIKDVNLKAAFESTASQANDITPEQIKELFSKVITKENYTGIIDMLPVSVLKTFNYKISELPKAADDVVRLAEKAQALTLPNTAAESAKGFAQIKTILNIRNPKAALEEFKKSAEKMSDDAFAEKMQLIGFSSMDKKTCLEILPKLEKILDRIPEKELKQITDAFVKEFNEHPDEVMKLLNSGRIKEVFNTPYLRKVMAALGLINTTVVGALTLFVSFILADLQLKAGRLGVMKAIESLDDPAYYADLETVETNKTAQNETKTENNAMNLLKSIKSPLTK